MIALILARAVTFFSGELLLGIPAVLAIAVLPALRGEARLSQERLPPVLSHLLRILWGTGLLGLLAGAAWLLLQAASISGRAVAEAASSAVLVPVLWRTHFGHAMLARLILTLLALAGIALVPSARTPRRRSLILAAVALPAAGALVALGWAGHAVATPGAVHLVADASHLLAGAIWLGGLVVLAVLFAAGRGKAHAAWIAAIAAATRRFSRLGVACVALLLASGIVESWFLVGTVPALVGTAYGHLLLVKLALFAAMVGIAAVNRLHLTPGLGGAARDRRPDQRLARLRRNTVAELVLFCLVLLVVGALGAIAPAVHDQPWWPFSYRYGGDALAVPELRVEIVIALAAVTIGLALCLASLAWRRDRTLMILVGLTLIGFYLPSFRILLVAAYPTTFYISPVAYTTESIARGARLYAEHCAACHGAAGRGDGPAAAGLKVPPADLTAAHVLDHSEGDIFWWLSAGIAESGMPGFADQLSEQERWDLVNWVRTLPVGGLEEGLVDEVGEGSAPRAPDFTFETADGREGSLQDLLRNGPLLLVLYTPAAAAPRLQRLAAAERTLADAGLGILALPLADGDAPNSAPLPHFVAQADASVAATYRMLAAAPGHPPRKPASHLEFLIDRNGFARALWRADETMAWSDVGNLLTLVRQLEKRPLAPASQPAHIH